MYEEEYEDDERNELFCVTLNNMTKDDVKFYARTYGLCYRPATHKGFDLAGKESNIRHMLEDYIGRYSEIGKIMDEGRYIPEWNRGEFRCADAKIKDSDPWHELAHYELTYDDGSKENDTIPIYVKRDMSEEDIIEYFQGYHPEDKIVKIKQIGWSRMGDKKVKDYRLRTMNNIKEAKEHITAYIDMFLNNDDELTEKYEKKFKSIKKDSDTLNTLGKKLLKYTKNNPDWEDEDLNEEIYRLLKTASKNIKDSVEDIWYVIKDEDIRERNVGNVPFFKRSLFGELYDNGFKCKWKAGDLYTTCPPNKLKKIYSEGKFINGPKTLAEFYLKPGYSIQRASMGDSCTKIKDTDYKETTDENIEALQEYLDWEGIYGYTYEIVEVYETNEAWVDEELETYDNAEEALNAFFNWEGIYGYTDAVMDILENGKDSSYYQDMLEEKNED